MSVTSSELMTLVFESNLINFTIVSAAIVYLGIRFIPGMASKRKDELQAQIIEAQRAKEEAEAKLEEIEAKLAQSQSDSERFLEEAKGTASKIREQILETTKKEISIMQELAEKDIEQQRNTIVSTIKTKVIEAAFKLTEESVKSDSNRGKIEKTIKEKFSKELAEINI